jgi:hypothetical protein
MPTDDQIATAKTSIEVMILFLSRALTTEDITLELAATGALVLGEAAIWDLSQ